MRVNSHFTGFFAHGWVVRPGMALAMLAIFFSASSFTKHPDHDLREKQVNLIIRHIGHRLLLQAGDYTSRVLPVTETKEGTFLLQFENEFVFSHDSLMAMAQDLLPETQFPSGYTVTVHDCLTDGIVYGFQFKNDSPDLLPCRGRHQPPGCYSIEFDFPDFYKDIDQENADVDQRTEELKPVTVDPQETAPTEEPASSEVARQEAHPKPEEIKPAPSGYAIQPQEVHPKLEEIKPAPTDYPLMHLVYGGMLVLLGVALLMGRFGRIFTPGPVSDQNHALIEASVPEWAALGKFLFDVKGQRLLLGSEVIPLTDKECKILELFNQSFGELIPRETLMQKIWINEGVITGRSLDMFVSKLRKKLSGDPGLRITNVHGKGYKLEMPGM